MGELASAGIVTRVGAATLHAAQPIEKNKDAISRDFMKLKLTDAAGEPAVAD